MPVDPVTRRAKWTQEEIASLRIAFTSWSQPSDILNNTPLLIAAGYSVRQIKEQISYQGLTQRSFLPPSPPISQTIPDMINSGNLAPDFASLRNLELP